MYLKWDCYLTENINIKKKLSAVIRTRRTLYYTPLKNRNECDGVTQ